MYAFVIFGAWSFLSPDSRFHSKGSKATPRGGRMCSAKPVEAEPEIRSPDSRRKSPETRRSSSINNSCKVERATRVPRAHSALSLQLIHRPCLAFPLSPRLCSMPLFLFSLPPPLSLAFFFSFSLHISFLVLVLRRQSSTVSTPRPYLILVEFNSIRVKTERL